MAGKLIEAIEAGDAEQVKQLLDEHPELAAERDGNGVSALLVALYNGLPVTDDIRAHLDELDVFEAAAVGDAERLRTLLAEDASLARAWTEDGFTALHYAAFFGTSEAARALLEHSADADALATHPQLKVRPIHSAAASQQVETVRLLLDHGADVNSRQEGGFSALHSAAFHDDGALAELLLERGAERSLATDDGDTPADTAAKQGHDELAALLRSDA